MTTHRNFGNGLGRQRSHRCNGCHKVFSCYPCTHGVGEVFCSADCLGKRPEESTEPQRATVYDTYLKRAGIGAKPRGTEKPTRQRSD